MLRLPLTKDCSPFARKPTHLLDYSGRMPPAERSRHLVRPRKRLARGWAVLAGIAHLIRPGALVTPADISALPPSPPLDSLANDGSQGPLLQPEAHEIEEALTTRRVVAAMPGPPAGPASWQLRYWTQWWDSDTPQSGDGDQELISEFLQLWPATCGGQPPVGLDCTTFDYKRKVSIAWFNTKDKLEIPCSLAQGGIRCLNAQNPKGCSNYRIRIDCGPPMVTPAPSFSPSIAKTLAPTRWVDRSKACSGNGVTVCTTRTDACDCLCDPGWHTDDCSAYVLNAAIDGETNECEGAPLSLPLTSLMPGRQYLSCSENRTSWQSRSFLNVSLSVAPTSPVSCQLSSSDVTVATPSLTSVSFSPGDVASKEVSATSHADDTSSFRGSSIVGDVIFLFRSGCWAPSTQ